MMQSLSRYLSESVHLLYLFSAFIVRAYRLTAAFDPAAINFWKLLIPVPVKMWLRNHVSRLILQNSRQI